MFIILLQNTTRKEQEYVNLLSYGPYILYAPL